MKPRQLTQEQLQAVCDAWNRANARGAPVWYRDDNGQMMATATRDEAFVLSGHTAVIFVDGKSGCVALERVTVRP
jgi:hypothetical protein